MALVLRKEESETWLEAAQRLGKRYGLEEEIRADYEKYAAEGLAAHQAAWAAAYEADVLEYEETL